jgi:hypothetical protein
MRLFLFEVQWRGILLLYYVSWMQWWHFECRALPGTVQALSFWNLGHLLTHLHVWYVMAIKCRGSHLVWVISLNKPAAALYRSLFGEIIVIDSSKLWSCELIAWISYCEYSAWRYPASIVVHRFLVVAVRSSDWGLVSVLITKGERI